MVATSKISKKPMNFLRFIDCNGTSKDGNNKFPSSTSDLKVLNQ